MNLSGIKKNARRSLLLTALLAACLGGLSSGALAQAWPGKPITIVSPYPAGGITDLLCRIVGEELAKVFGQPVLVENRLGAGGAIAMPKMLVDGGTDYDDGTVATEGQQAKDVTAFLMWAAEPKMEERKKMGFVVILYLLMFSGLLYAAYRQVWKNESH